MRVRFTATIVGEYDIPTLAYNPEGGPVTIETVQALDEANFREYPESFFEDATSFTFEVEEV